MKRIKSFFATLYLQARLFIVIWALVGLFLFGYLFPILYPAAQLGTALLFVLTLIDTILVYARKAGMSGERELPERFSNGDPNPISVHIQNHYPYTVSGQVIDELPFQFQTNHVSAITALAPNASHTITYTLRPTERGQYQFGVMNVFVFGPLGLVRRRYQLGSPQEVPTYPSFLQMRSYQLMAISNRLTEVGVKKIRRLGHTTEFETIKEYVRGDDYRTINWKATARNGKIMVNQYMDERAQHVYFLLDKSRVMKMPFEGLSLLDYAINSTLVLSNTVIHKHDRAGLLTFAHRLDSVVKADNKPTQMNRILEVLYKEKTDFLEADYGRVYGYLKQKISQRSLMMLFTNFESLTAMRRQLPYLQGIAKQHLLVVVFFENVELSSVLASSPENMEALYIKAIAEHTQLQKKQIARELQRYGIHTILTPPKGLTINALNKYLEIKSRGMA